MFELARFWSLGDFYKTQMKNVNNKKIEQLLFTRIVKVAI